MRVINTFIDPHWLIDEADDRPIEFVIVLVSTHFHDDNILKIHQLLDENNIVIDSSNAWSNDNTATEIFFTTSTVPAWVLFKKCLILAENRAFDIALLPVASRKKKLLVCDMDSTIVQSETLDDIAESVGVGDQVKAITVRAMQGEMDFRQALDERVGLLGNMAADILDEIANKVQFNSGAETLISLAREQGIRTVLVSGGFEPIVKVVANKLGFDRYVCNRLETSNGQLTGKVVEPIIDGDSKLNILQEECQRLSIHSSQACAIGDGANDIQMLQAAGLGIGFQGKPLVRAAISHQINKTGLDTALMMMGIVK
ncbi:MAG: phosphoserine phosphatase [Gammaproteobacteria bacterium]|jgi:phosphoserine phosphatase